MQITSMKWRQVTSMKDKIKIYKIDNKSRGISQAAFEELEPSPKLTIQQANSKLKYIKVSIEFIPQIHPRDSFE